MASVTFTVSLTSIEPRPDRRRRCYLTCTYCVAVFDHGFYRVIGGPYIHWRLWGGRTDGPRTNGRTHAEKESERGDYCLSTEELQAVRLPAAAAGAAADADGSVALVNGGGGGVMVCGPSYFHGEE